LGLRSLEQYLWSHGSDLKKIFNPLETLC
jgi:hypothetical protein